MPIYEYRCNGCGEVFARLQSISTATEDSIPCPECESTETERLLSTFAAGPSSSETAACGVPAGCGASGGG
jgi:putative FmdB family regulatory protein